jgi:hypothetical protein
MINQQLNHAIVELDRLHGMKKLRNKAKKPFDFSSRVR